MFFSINRNIKAQNTACPSKFFHHLDCIYQLADIGYHVDTLHSLLPGKFHTHALNLLLETMSCWDITVDTLFTIYSCGYCGYSDPKILDSSFLPNTSKIYKFFSIYKVSSKHVLFHYEDLILYNNEHQGSLPIPDKPYCCTSNPPEDCQTCNCGVGFVDWEAKRFGVIPARGNHWNQQCEQTIP